MLLWKKQEKSIEHSAIASPEEVFVYTQAGRKMLVQVQVCLDVQKRPGASTGDLPTGHGQAASPHIVDDGLRTGYGLPQFLLIQNWTLMPFSHDEDLHQFAFALWQATGIPLLFL